MSSKNKSRNRSWDVLRYQSLANISEGMTAAAANWIPTSKKKGKADGDKERQLVDLNAKLKTKQ